MDVTLESFVMLLSNVGVITRFAHTGEQTPSKMVADTITSFAKHIRWAPPVNTLE
jgi:hypothetical protein